MRYRGAGCAKTQQSTQKEICLKTFHLFCPGRVAALASSFTKPRKRWEGLEFCGFWHYQQQAARALSHGGDMRQKILDEKF
jgi:hypothetical protein